MSVVQNQFADIDAVEAALEARGIRILGTRDLDEGVLYVRDRKVVFVDAKVPPRDLREALEWVWASLTPPPV